MGTPSVPSPSPTASLKVIPAIGTVKGCIGQTQASVTGAGISSVTFVLDGQQVGTDTTSNANGAYTLDVSCSQFRSGTSGTAVVSFGGSTPPQTLPFQVALAG
jgi:hypothetical protein